MRVQHELLGKLCTRSKKTSGEIAAALEITVDQLYKILRGSSGTRRAVIQRAAELFGVEYSQLVHESSNGPNGNTSWDFNSRKWLRHDSAPLVGPSNSPFQTFEQTEANRVCIAYMWTEAWCDWIRTTRRSPAASDLSAVLVVDHHNEGLKAPPYICVHPENKVPRKRGNDQLWLCFEARYVKSASTLPPVIGVRVGDADHYQWRYKGLNRWVAHALKEEFTCYYHNLLDTTRWKVLGPRHPALPAKPNFDLITTVAFEFGFGSEFNTHGSGEATVEIKNICLSTKADFVPRLEENQTREMLSRALTPIDRTDSAH